MKTNDQLFMQEEMLYWYDNEYIILPWRNDKDPYKIWVSEIMLQQTRVEAVIPFFERFINRLPTIKDLAMIEEDDLMKLWQGLGYYRRVKNMKIAANQIIDEFDGVMPNTIKDLMTLKGIGEYTSGAISSIAFDQTSPAVDGNILRIYARLFGVKEDIRESKTRQKLTQLYIPYIPNDRPGDFNQALMDLGRKICTPSKNPKCEDCPLNSKCYTYKHNLQESIPFLSKKKARKKQEVTVLIFINNHKVWIRKRPDKGLLSSLYEYTTVNHHLGKEKVKEYLASTHLSIKSLPDAKHIFTHIEWEMKAYVIETLEEKIDNVGLYVDIEELETTYSIPTAFKTYTNWLFKKKQSK